MIQPPLLQEPITLNKLESHLWEAANILRGSPVDRTDWKSYILPLLFFKRICDVWDEEYLETVELYGEDFEDEHRFQIPDGCHWRDVRQTPTNVGTALQNAMRGIEAANQEHLYGVFGDAQWSNKERLPDALLKDLIEHFSALPLGNSHVTSDIIGDAYEYLIKQFADATNRKAGEFYTPRSVVRLMVNILDPQEGETIYDPACGTGGMLLAAVEHVRDNGGDPRTGGLAAFDCVIANPPFSLEQWGREIWESDPWGRAFAGLPSDKSGDFAWVQHMVTSMAAYTGRMAVVLPQGALFRGGVEGQIRRKLLEQDLIEAVIGLAPNLFYGTGLAACILILRKRKDPHRAGQVLIVDASSLFRKARAQNFLDPEHTATILEWVQTFEDVKDRTRVVSVEEIKEEDWTLNISRYVLPPIGEDIPPLPEAIADFKAALNRVRQAEDRLRVLMEDGGWLEERD
jgi:type I restriction enzyme M protein